MCEKSCVIDQETKERYKYNNRPRNSFLRLAVFDTKHEAQRLRKNSRRYKSDAIFITKVPEKAFFQPKAFGVQKFWLRCCVKAFVKWKQMAKYKNQCYNFSSTRNGSDSSFQFSFWYNNSKSINFNSKHENPFKFHLNLSPIFTVCPFKTPIGILFASWANKKSYCFGTKKITHDQIHFNLRKFI